MSGWAQREAERAERVEEFTAEALEAHMRLSARIEAECERYGLPYGDPTKSLEALLKHVYANRDLAHAANMETIRVLEKRLADAWDEGTAYVRKHPNEYAYAQNPYRETS